MARTRKQYTETSDSQKLKSSRHTTGQKELIKSIRWNDITIGIGKAGTGKTSATLETAIRLLNEENSPIEKILYIRANVGLKGEKDLGTPPGDLKEKADHLSYPVRDNLSEFMGKGEIDALFDFGKIEVSPICNLRGRSLTNTVIILDESQNCSMHALKTVITRLGHDSRLVIIGDPDQCDVDFRRWDRMVMKACTINDRIKESIESRTDRLEPLSSFLLSMSYQITNSRILPALVDNHRKLPILELVHRMETAKSENESLAIGIVHFSNRDIVRHPILGEIMDYL